MTQEKNGESWAAAWERMIKETVDLAHNNLDKTESQEEVMIRK